MSGIARVCFAEYTRFLVDFRSPGHVLTLSSVDGLLDCWVPTNEQTKMNMKDNAFIYSRAIGISRTACKNECRRTLRSHSCSVFLTFYYMIALLKNAR